jgi:hypothetical protein
LHNLLQKNKEFKKQGGIVKIEMDLKEYILGTITTLRINQILRRIASNNLKPVATATRITIPHIKRDPLIVAKPSDMANNTAVIWPKLKFALLNNNAEANKTNKKPKSKYPKNHELTKTC